MISLAVFQLATTAGPEKVSKSTEAQNIRSSLQCDFFMCSKRVNHLQNLRYIKVLLHQGKEHWTACHWVYTF